MKKLISFFAFLFILVAANNLVAQDYYEKIYDTVPKYPIKTTVNTYREPAISTLLSCAVPGLGQFYNGQKGKGLGFMLWWGSSEVMMFYSFFNMFDHLLDKGNGSAPVVFLIAGTSVLTSWIVSMVDANKSAKAINSQLGFASIQLGERTNLSFNPDFKLVNNYSPINSNSISPTYGLNIRLSF